jgi:hypothetical protein
MAMAAARTKRIMLGSGAVGVFNHHNLPKDGAINMSDMYRTLCDG